MTERLDFTAPLPAVLSRQKCPCGDTINWSIFRVMVHLRKLIWHDAGNNSFQWSLTWLNTDTDVSLSTCLLQTHIRKHQNLFTGHTQVVLHRCVTAAGPVNLEPLFAALWLFKKSQTASYLSTSCFSGAGFSESEPFFDFILKLRNLNFFFSPSAFCTSLSGGAAGPASLLENKLFRDFLGEPFAAISATHSSCFPADDPLIKGRRESWRSGEDARGWNLPTGDSCSRRFIFCEALRAQVWRHAPQVTPRAQTASHWHRCPPSYVKQIIHLNYFNIYITTEASKFKSLIQNGQFKICLLYYWIIHQCVYHLMLQLWKVMVLYTILLGSLWIYPQGSIKSYSCVSNLNLILTYNSITIYFDFVL